MLEENFQMFRKNMEQISNKQCQTPFAWNISQSWALTSKKLLTGIWRFFFFRHQTPNSSLSTLALMILSHIYLLPFASLPAVSYRKNKRKYLQYLVVTWRKKTTYLSHEKEQKNLNQESRSCAIISFWFLSLTYTCISMHKYFIFF